MLRRRVLCPLGKDYGREGQAHWEKANEEEANWARNGALARGGLA